MAEPLKRTFHGCLTCRRRKVRCLGGTPCLNCSRMKVECQSSFDNNLRIRVSTPTGQKNLGSRSASPTTQNRQQHAQQSAADVTSTPRSLPDASASSFAADPIQFPLTHQAMPYDSDLPNLPSSAVSSAWSQGIEANDCSSFPGAWAPGIPPADNLPLQYAFYPNARDQAANSFAYPQAYLDPSAMAVPNFQHDQVMQSQNGMDFSNWWMPSTDNFDNRGDGYGRHG